MMHIKAKSLSCSFVMYEPRESLSFFNGTAINYPEGGKKKEKLRKKENLFYLPIKSYGA